MCSVGLRNCYGETRLLRPHALSVMPLPLMVFALVASKEVMKNGKDKTKKQDGADTETSSRTPNDLRGDISDASKWL